MFFLLFFVVLRDLVELFFRPLVFLVDFVLHVFLFQQRVLFDVQALFLVFFDWFVCFFFLFWLFLFLFIVKDAWFQHESEILGFNVELFGKLVVDDRLVFFLFLVFVVFWLFFLLVDWFLFLFLTVWFVVLDRRLLFPGFVFDFDIRVGLVIFFIEGDFLHLPVQIANDDFLVFKVGNNADIVFDFLVRNVFILLVFDKDEIAVLWLEVFRSEQLLFGQILDPLVPVVAVRDLLVFNAGIFKNERREHDVPALVWFAVPVAVAGVVVFRAILVDFKVVFDFLVVFLGLGDLRDAVGRFFFQFGWNGMFPLLFRFLVVLVGLALSGVGMGFLATNELGRPEAFLAVSMAFHRFFFLFLAYEFLLFLKAFIGVLVILVACQNGFDFVTVVRVRVAFDRFGFFQTALRLVLAFVAFVGVLVLFLAAIVHDVVTFHRDGGQDEGVRRAEDDDAAQNGYETVPYAFLLSFVVHGLVSPFLWFIRRRWT